jgi:hypothetical protein
LASALRARKLKAEKHIPANINKTKTTLTIFIAIIHSIFKFLLNIMYQNFCFLSSKILWDLWDHARNDPGRFYFNSLSPWKRNPQGFALEMYGKFKVCFSSGYDGQKG